MPNNQNSTEKEQSKTLTYDFIKIQNVINCLKIIPVAGFDNVNAMKFIFDVLGNPLQDNPKESDIKQ